ncbi:MAG: hypothetical protein ACK41F_02095 [Fimbriimonadaceae bacterium]
MTTIPTWWLWVSGAFFLIASVAWILIAVLVLRVFLAVQALRPKVEATLEKVEGVAVQVEQLATAARSTVETVGGKAKTVAGAFELLALATASRFQAVSRVLAALGAGAKVVNMLKGLRPKKAGLDNKPEKKAK